MYKLRTKKIKLIDKYKKLHGELVQIQKEITQGQVIIGPSVPEISKDHYPEKNIELDIQMPKEYQDPPSATPLLIVPVLLLAYDTFTLWLIFMHNNLIGTI